MFVLDNENQIEKAMQKARKVKPLVKLIAFGVYAVKGSKGNSYTVKCSRNPLGQKQVDCECEGGRKGLVCYHTAAALGLHIVLAEQRQSVAA
ncbi:hypothetical protein BH20ACI1_BH20ACI1_20150 [soil metagenome]